MMNTPQAPPNVIWLCRECWKGKAGNTPPPIPTFIARCAECGAQDVPLVYVKVDTTLIPIPSSELMTG